MTVIEMLDKWLREYKAGNVKPCDPGLRDASILMADGCRWDRQQWEALVADLRDALSENRAPFAATPRSYDKLVGIEREIEAELERSIRELPLWPSDPIHAAAIVADECGELTQAAFQACYEPELIEPQDARIEAIQTAAMCIRFLLSMDRYEFRRGAGHYQKGSGVVEDEGCPSESD